MPLTPDGPIISWLEMAMLAKSPYDAAEVAIRAVRLGESQPCFGVTYQQRWLCGNDGALTYFDSAAAATRFLSLLSIDGYFVERRRSDSAGQDAFQQFRLGARGLTPCKQVAATSQPRV
jgi:hypothetical protein